ncbi:MAG: hypothetical protein ABJA67_17240 [Chthonomonadales bacterium]
MSKQSVEIIGNEISAGQALDQILAIRKLQIARAELAFEHKRRRAFIEMMLWATGPIVLIVGLIVYYTPDMIWGAAFTITLISLPLIVSIVAMDNRSKLAAVSLCHADTIETIGPLLEARSYRLPRWLHQLIEERLVELLPKLSPADELLLELNHHKMLQNIVTSSCPWQKRHADLVLAALHAMEAIGTRGDLESIHALANRSDSLPGSPHMKLPATEAHQNLTARLESLHDAHHLLRPASPDENLLRPAYSGTPTDSDVLLRPIEGDAFPVENRQ